MEAVDSNSTPTRGMWIRFTRERAALPDTCYSITQMMCAKMKQHPF